jgi:hypothetical protein
MSLRNKLAIVMVTFLAPIFLVSMASAQAGSPCSGASCGLGGQIRQQVGDGVPVPISFAAAQGGSGSLATEGPFTAITIQAGPATPMALPLVGKGLGQPGQVKPGLTATIMQTTAPGTGPRGLTLAPGLFTYANQPQGSVAVVNFNDVVFAVQTNFILDIPHPGTTSAGAQAFTFMGASVPTPNANVFSAGGRRGAATVTFYANAASDGPGSPTNNYGHGVPPTSIQTPMAGEGGIPPINGIARFTRTSNQFGGQVIPRTLGSVKVFLNGKPLDPAVDLPCKITATPLEGTTAQGTFVPFVTGGPCEFSLSVLELGGTTQVVGVEGGKFSGFTGRPGFETSTGVFTGTIGFNGTIIGQNAPVTIAGANIPVTGQGIQTVGFPMTTGMLSITVTLVQGETSEMFLRTGTDARDVAGNGVVALVTGSMSARSGSGGNANRTWVTLEIPEPSAILGASAGLLALFGCHRLVRRRP